MDCSMRAGANNIDEKGLNPYVPAKVHLYLLRFYLYINSFL